MFSIGYIQKKTGLSPHVLRVWEKRYQAVIPERSETNRRLYSAENLERLQLLAQLTRNGHKISQLADLPTTELQTLVADDQLDAPNAHTPSIDPPSCYPLEPLIQSIANYDQQTLDRHLDIAIRELGYSGLLEKVISPLMHLVGNFWHRGDFTTAQEHAATSFIKDYLIQRTRSFSPEPNAPILLATTPSGQLHELGTFFATCHAAKLGWRTIYLGPSLPADEISGAALRAGATAVLLGLQYPADDPNIPTELLRIHKQLEGKIPLLVGGTACDSYQPTLEKINTAILGDFSELSSSLDAIRNNRL